MKLCILNSGISGELRGKWWAKTDHKGPKNPLMPSSGLRVDRRAFSSLLMDIFNMDESTWALVIQMLEIYSLLEKLKGFARLGTRSKHMVARVFQLKDSGIIWTAYCIKRVGKQGLYFLLKLEAGLQTCDIISDLTCSVEWSIVKWSVHQNLLQNYTLIIVSKLKSTAAKKEKVQQQNSI